MHISPSCLGFVIQYVSWDRSTVLLWFFIIAQQVTLSIICLLEQKLSIICLCCFHFLSLEFSVAASLKWSCQGLQAEVLHFYHLWFCHISFYFFYFSPPVLLFTRCSEGFCVAQRVTQTPPDAGVCPFLSYSIQLCLSLLMWKQMVSIHQPQEKLNTENIRLWLWI